MRKIVVILTILMTFSVVSYSQGKSVYGTVKDTSGIPIPFATINEKNTKNATAADVNGNFSISVKEGAILLVSATGFNDQESNTEESPLNIVLVAKNNQTIDEVVVTGYSSIKKSNYVGAASVVSSKTISNVPMASIDQILQGQSPGLYIAAGSGQPGTSNVNIIIRGVASINGSSVPLFILDGIPIDVTDFANLNPNDVENVTILKDASAKSLYGSRGANGVIVITTKRGKTGSVKFNYSGQTGWNEKVNNNVTFLNSAQHLQLEELYKTGAGWQYSPNNPANTSLSDATKARYASILDTLRGINTNWEDYFLKKGGFQSHNLSASGGGENATYYISMGYLDQDGLAPRSWLKRYSLRSKIDYAKDKLKFGLSLGTGYSRSSFIESDAGIALANPYAAAYLGLPYEQPYGPDGTILTIYRLNQIYGASSNWPATIAAAGSRVGSNALARVDESTSFSNELKITPSIYASYRIWDGLSAKTTMGLDFTEYQTNRSIYPNTNAGSNVNPGKAGLLTRGSSRTLLLNSQTGFNYNKEFGKSFINADAIFEVNRYRLENFNYTGYGINPKLLNTPAGITPGTTTNGLIPLVGGGYTQNGTNSYFVTGTYTYNKKYSFNGSVRRDGSSIVAPKNKWHNFWAVGASWDIKKEEFLENSATLSNLVLRISYGLAASGNAINAFQYLSQYGQGSYAGTVGQIPTYPGNPELDWEYNKEGNIGIDYGFISNRIRGSVDVYNRITENLFLDQILPRTGGFTSLTINAGSMRNRGIEVDFNGDAIRTKDIQWTLGFNFAYNWNKITNLGQAQEYPSGTSIIRVGLPFGSHFITKYAGVDAATGDALFYTKEGKLTKNFSDEDAVAEFGSNIPPFTGGWSTSFQYKGFYLRAQFVFVKDMYIFNNQTYFTDNGAFINAYNQSTNLLNTWTTPGQVTNTPRPGTASQFNSYDIEDASYIKFRNLQVGYNLPQKWVTATKFFTQANIFFQGQNLYTWTKWSGFDPEFASNLASYQYPPSKVYTFGINVNF